MGYEDEAGRSRRGRSRGRRTAGVDGIENGRGSAESMREGREPGQSEPGLDLITDGFSDRGRSQAAGEPSGRRASRKKAADTVGGGSRDIYADSLRKKARRRKRRIRIILVEALILVAVLLFGAYTYVSSRLDLMQRLPWDPEEIRNVDISEEKAEQMKGYWTIAIFGVDSRSESVGKGNNSDVNIICNINQDTGEIRLVSVYRDTYLNISDKNVYNKINAAYLNGGPEQAVKALNKNLDLDIDDYATFNWKAVADAINILGGIDVEITKAEFYYINAFITETVKATGIGSYQLKSAGMNHLDGVQAVAYGRLRLMDTDYARTERQRKVISLAFEKAKQADWATINNIIQTVFPQVATSVEMTDLLNAGRNVAKYHLTETMGFPAARGEANMGSKGACVIPQTLVSNVTELHRFLFGDENYEPTEMVRTISQKIISDTGLAKEKEPVGDVGTGGGSVPTSAAARETEDSSLTESLPEETEEESREISLYPGWERETEEEPETDSQGNLIIRPGSHETEGAGRPGGGIWQTEEETSEEEVIIRPGSTTQESTESSSAAPGETEGSTSGVIIRPGETGSGTSSGGSSVTPGGTSSGNGSSTTPGGTSGGNGSSVTPGGSSTTPGGTSSGNGSSSTSGGNSVTPGGTGSSDSSGSQTSTGVIIVPAG